MRRAGLVGGGPGPLAAGYPWRVLRLGESLDATWQGGGAARVSATSQDPDGWIDLDLENPSPTGLEGYRRWVLRDLAGLPIDDAGQLDQAGILRVRLQVDWTGTAGETVAIGLCDEDGDLSLANGWITVAYRTASSGASVVTQAAGSSMNDDPVGGPVSALDAVFLPPRDQIGAMMVGALADPYDGSVVGGGSNGSGGPTSGPRRLVISVSCDTDDDDGPHPVRFRVWYAWIPALQVPT